MKRVLILVLSTDKPPYDKLFEASRDTWDSLESKTEGVDTIFYFANTSKLVSLNDQGALLTDSDDDFFSMGKKTLCAFEWALKYCNFDFIFRANASLYVDKPGLLRYVQNWPAENLALGVVADCGSFEGERFSYLWGPSYLLSRDVVEKVVANKDKWEHNLMDDNAISRLLTQLEIPLDNRGSMASVAIDKGWYGFVYYENGVSGGTRMYSLKTLREQLPNQFCFRVKCDADRAVDVRLMKELHEVFKT